VLKSTRRLTLACAKCGRRGAYAVARLIERHGDMTLIRLLEALSADCLRRRAKNYSDWCAGKFEGRSTWLSSRPFSKSAAGRQAEEGEAMSD
jgi:hypothetical protein